MLFAEYYSFIDSNGVKHYTDNILEVPVDQRPNLNVYSTIKSPENEPEKITESEKKTGSDNSNTPESLAIKKNELDIEYSALVQKQDALMAQKSSLDPKEFNDLVQQLNEKILAYQEKSLVYEKSIEQYNEQLLPPAANE